MSLNRAGRREAARQERSAQIRSSQGRSRRVGAAVTAGTAALGGAAAFVAGTATTAGALISYEVTNNADSGPGSLRQAIIDSNSDAGDSQITFAANVTGTIPVSSQLEVYADDNLTIIGPGSGVLSLVGDGGNRIFYSDGSFDGDVLTIRGLTVTGGQAGFNGGGIKFYDCAPCDLVLDDVVVTNNTAVNDAGGISMYSAGDLTITNSVISRNTATGGGAGGIDFYNSGDLTISRTTVSGNTAQQWAGGLYFYNATSLTILASTFSENRALNGGGGAMWVGSDDDGIQDAPVLIANSTFTGNSAGGAGDPGGALALYAGEVQILQSTISGNDAAGDIGDGLYIGDQIAAAGAEGRGGAEKPTTKEDGTPKAPKEPPSAEVEPQAVVGPVVITGSIVSGNDVNDIGTEEDAVEVTSTNNLIGTVSDGIDLTSVETIISSTPGLAPLASNGGPTQTMALLATSAALNTGPVPVPAFPGNDTDQRGAGFARVSDGRVDIGAYEVQVPEPIVLEPTFTG